jgi:O-6-methylguanine DNA methyltransferase
MAETIRYGLGTTLVGKVLIAVSDRGLCALHLMGLEGEHEPVLVLRRMRQDFPTVTLLEDPSVVAGILARVNAFLDGTDTCADLALDLRGTPFQNQVWTALRQISRGATKTYGQLARELGVPGAARAVGAACGANPVWLLVPCHRVVREGGHLGGYGAGLEVKRALLELEGCDLGQAKAGRTRPAQQIGRATP